MKRQGNLYHRVYNFGNLLQAARKAQKSKRFKPGCRDFNFDLEKTLLSIQKELKEKTYRPGPYHRFRIFEPKERIISAAPYRDRVVHHALVNIIEPIFERGMIYDSYANRRGKGTHKAVERFTEFSRKRSYVLKMDIVRYFPNMDHEILMTVIEKKIKDKDIIWLIRVILDSGREPEGHGSLFYFPGDDLFTPLERKKGLPIGNLTSQLFANIYLDGFDHFVKEDLQCRQYIRHMDDMVVFDNRKDRLRHVRVTLIEALERLRLTFHMNKAQYWPVSQGTDWLGYRVYPTHRYLRKSNIKRFQQRFKRLAEEYRKDIVDIQKVKSSVMSWIGHVKHADSYNLRREIFGNISFQR
jgi:retron-type reverse transcriptase